MIDCSGQHLEFQSRGRCEVIGRLDSGKITSDGGALLLRELEKKARILEGFARWSDDHRAPEAIEPRLAELLKQRVIALAQSSKNLNDQDKLPFYPLLATRSWRGTRHSRMSTSSFWTGAE